ncbi:MAG: metallophosphoesterase family protein [Bacteroidales bacterium]
MSDFVIGDIHGCNKTTKKLVEDVLRPAPADRLIFVGDYIDRGPGSKEVIDFILDIQQHESFEVIALRGNHEQMLLDAMKNPEAMGLWLMNHGDTTLASYGLKIDYDNPAKTFADFPQQHYEFLKQTSFYFEADDYIAVHAGFDFNKPDFKADVHSMLWTRDMIPDLNKTGGRIIIHGHTPFPLDRIETQIMNKDKAINVDNGCKFKEMPGFGHLLAYEPAKQELFMQANVD